MRRVTWNICVNSDDVKFYFGIVYNIILSSTISNCKKVL